MMILSPKTSETVMLATDKPEVAVVLMTISALLLKNPATSF